VLKPGGRLAISDVVALAPLPAALASQIAALTGCVAGAARSARSKRCCARPGFDNIRIAVKPESRAFIREWMPGSGAEDYVASATIEATRPRGATA
jgi:arsenite methyltransferase